MERQQSQVYQVTVDSSGRIVIPAEARQRNHIAEGDTLMLVEDEAGLHVKSLEQVIREAQAHFATLAPPDVLLFDEINADRRAEHEHD